jgi:hypothetical protein
VAYEAFADDDATGNQRLQSRVLLTPPLDPAAVAGADGDPPGDAGADGGPRPEEPGVKSRGGGCGCALGAPATAIGWAPGLPGLLGLLGVLAMRLPRRRRR